VDWRFQNFSEINFHEKGKNSQTGKNLSLSLFSPIKLTISSFYRCTCDFSDNNSDDYYNDNCCKDNIPDYYSSNSWVKEFNRLIDVRMTLQSVCIKAYIYIYTNCLETENLDCRKNIAPSLFLSCYVQSPVI